MCTQFQQKIVSYKYMLFVDWWCENRWYRERLAAENPHLEELGGGEVVDLIVNVNYLDKIVILICFC